MNIHRSLTSPDSLGQLARGLQTAGLVGVILGNNIALFVLVIAQHEKNNIAFVDPHLFAELATDVAESLFTIKAESLESSVAQHLDNLGELQAFLLEGQIALFVVIFILAIATVFTALWMRRSGVS